MTRRLAHARGGPLEAHEASYQRVVATVRRVGIGAGEQLVEAALRIRFRSRNAEAKLPEPWCADRDKQRCDAPSMLPQVVEPRLNQVATRKIGGSGGSHGRDIAADPRVRDLRDRGSLPCVAVALGFQTGRRGTTYDFITLKSECPAEEYGGWRSCFRTGELPPEASSGRTAFVDPGHRQNKRPFSSTGTGTCIRVPRSQRIGSSTLIRNRYCNIGRPTGDPPARAGAGRARLGRSRPSSGWLAKGGASVQAGRSTCQAKKTARLTT